MGCCESSDTDRGPDPTAHPSFASFSSEIFPPSIDQVVDPTMATYAQRPRLPPGAFRRRRRKPPVPSSTLVAAPRPTPSHSLAPNYPVYECASIVSPNPFSVGHSIVTEQQQQTLSFAYNASDEINPSVQEPTTTTDAPVVREDSAARVHEDGGEATPPPPPPPSVVGSGPGRNDDTAAHTPPRNPPRPWTPIEPSHGASGGTSSQQLSMRRLHSHEILSHPTSSSIAKWVDETTQAMDDLRSLDGLEERENADALNFPDDETD